jgi:hypothetical protein
MVRSRSDTAFGRRWHRFGATRFMCCPTFGRCYPWGECDMTIWPLCGSWCGTQCVLYAVGLLLEGWVWNFQFDCFIIISLLMYLSWFDLCMNIFHFVVSCPIRTPVLSDQFSHEWCCKGLDLEMGLWPAPNSNKVPKFKFRSWKFCLNNYYDGLSVRREFWAFIVLTKKLSLS